MDILAFYFGISFVYLNPYLNAFALASLFIIKPHFRLLIFFIIGGLYAYLHAGPPKDFFDEAWFRKPMTVQIKVKTLPITHENNTQFIAEIQSSGLGSERYQAQMFCHKSCRHFKVGERYQVQLKLKPLQFFQNPGQNHGLNYAKFTHFYIKGQIIHVDAKLQHAPISIQSIRAYLANHLTELAPDRQILSLWQALTLGVTSNISPEDWLIFRQTGTTHLMVISGAHIGLVAGLVFKLCEFLWRRYSCYQESFPSKRFAALMSLIAGLLYTIIAGYGIPAERAFVGVFILMSRYFLSVRFGMWQAWRGGLLAVLVAEPHAVLMPGFYLSFIAVAVLIIVSSRESTYTIFSTQLACLIGLMPLTLYWFSYASVSGFFANLVAISWVGFVVVPLALLTLLISLIYPSSLVILPLKWGMSLLMIFLSWMTQFNFLNMTHSLHSITWGLGLMCILFIVSTFKAPKILCILPAYGALYIYHSVYVSRYPLEVNMLDVGQGLAVVVHTLNHTLIYDTGPQTYRGKDAATQVILPYLNARGVSSIDTIVVSHPDLDHRGGLVSLLKTYPKASLISNDPNFYHQGKQCHQMAPWSWDAVSFEFLGLPNSKKRNNTSCVLSVCIGIHCVLLTGDIENEAESYLIKHFSHKLKADVLLVPHHGSKTSSSKSFVEAVHPNYGLISYGRANSYRFPHSETLLMYQQQHIPLFDTARGGMISVLLGPKGGQVDSYV